LQQVLEGAGGNGANCPQTAESFGGFAGQMNPLRAPRSAVTAPCQNARPAMIPDAPEAHAISVWRRNLFQAAPPAQGSDPFIPK
jgi:hypothetical protein